MRSSVLDGKHDQLPLFSAGDNALTVKNKFVPFFFLARLHFQTSKEKYQNNIKTFSIKNGEYYCCLNNQMDAREFVNHIT